MEQEPKEKIFVIPLDLYNKKKTEIKRILVKYADITIDYFDFNKRTLFGISLDKLRNNNEIAIFTSSKRGKFLDQLQNEDEQISYARPKEKTAGSKIIESVRYAVLINNEGYCEGIAEGQADTEGKAWKGMWLKNFKNRIMPLAVYPHTQSGVARLSDHMLIELWYLVNRSETNFHNRGRHQFDILMGNKTGAVEIETKFDEQSIQKAFLTLISIDVLREEIIKEIWQFLIETWYKFKSSD